MNSDGRDKDLILAEALGREGAAEQIAASASRAAMAARVRARIEEERVGATAGPHSRPARRWEPWALAAAAVTLLALSFPLGMRLLPRRAEDCPVWRSGAGASVERVAWGRNFVTGPGERLCVMLDDSRILLCLAEGTRVRIDSRDEVFLELGEVWSDVRPDSGRYAVRTPDGTSTALGTSFGVSAGPSGTRTVVESGVVLVASPAGDEARVEAGQGATASPGAAPSAAPLAGEARPAWAREAVQAAAADAAARRYPSGAPGR
ncbi:MAG: FecR family protein [Candidatus Sumerlaeia bacterium]|nr:FecR family protein [Candidatus Sumerlaeia bacterium]